MVQIMESYLYPGHFDLVSPDGKINTLSPLGPNSAEAIVFIENISPSFVGYKIDKNRTIFNLKSLLAQVGINSQLLELELNPARARAEVKLRLYSIGPIGQEMLSLLSVGAYIGKLFAADERRVVRDSHYLLRMFGRADKQGRPLLSLGGLQGSDDLIMEKIDGRTVAYLSLLPGVISYDATIRGFLPTLAQSLHKEHLHPRSLLQLHQLYDKEKPRQVKEKELLLVRTQPLHISTAFARVVDSLLPQGYQHTAASVLQPDTAASGDIYELFGSSPKDINDIPLEFYTLEPHREYVFFSDRDQLQTSLENPEILFDTFAKAPGALNQRAAVFVVKGEQLLHLRPEDWILREPHSNELPGMAQPERQALMIERYIKQQACYPFLQSIEEGLITSEGVLLLRYFPSPLMKQLLLSPQIHPLLKGIYFQYPSLSHGNFFSQEDRALLLDLTTFAIPVFWVDQTQHKILQYVTRTGKSSGLFVPREKVADFLKSTIFGLYGSNLMEGSFEREIQTLLKGLQQMRATLEHPLLNPATTLSLVTGGGPGVMELGNRVAKQLGILSCANIADFRIRSGSYVNEQHENPYIEAKMTYHLERLIERQAEFNLDFPIFLIGGIGTDFEYSLEELRRKISSNTPTPILLFGAPDYWRQKISSRFQCNLHSGTIVGSEWISNCFYCVQTAEEGLEVYRQFFQGTLPIGRDGPVYQDGFCQLQK